LAAYLVHPESDGLGAALVAQLSDQDQEPTHQLAHWLFAFDAVGITIFRALGLLASRPDLLARARTDDGAFQRACILETLRLWPTTPSLILRGSTRPTVWGEGELPAGTTFFIFVPFLHRDPSYPDADYFTPELWLKGSTPNVRDRVLLPFSGGPGVCPGRHLVLLIGSEAIAALVGSNHLLMNNERFGPGRRMPATYDHTSIGVTLLQPSGKEASS
jgi:cytochrome P450